MAEVTKPLLEDGTGRETRLDTELRAVVARTALQDERALERLYDLTFGKVYAVALRILRNAEAAEEVVEDTYWQAWREASRYDPARGRTLAWLLTICHSRALDALRRREPAEPIADFESLQSDVAAEKTDPYDLLDAIQRSSAIHAAIGKLKPQVLRREQDAFTYLLKLEPGAALLPHDHPQDEECIVLSGEARIGDLVVRAGDYHCAYAGKPHGVISSEQGAVLFLRGAVPAANQVRWSASTLAALATASVRKFVDRW